MKSGGDCDDIDEEPKLDAGGGSGEPKKPESPRLEPPIASTTAPGVESGASCTLLLYCGL